MTTATPDPDHSQLYADVRKAIASLPLHFRTETRISGIVATDLHTLSTVLGATIEEQVVSTLNQMRNTWDPQDECALYGFVRQAQTFPDVLLRRSSDGHVLLGIELKGWYLLAKEREPSLRFQVTEAACADQDLVVVVPWALNHVISGSPVVFEPFVESAKGAARHRNYHWQHVRSTKLDTSIRIPRGISPYPRKSEQILDRPFADGGGNFGRLARTGLMDAYIQRLHDVSLCGIKTTYWQDFLRTFQDGTADADARTALLRLQERVERVPSGAATTKVEAITAVVTQLGRLLDADA